MRGRTNVGGGGVAEIYADTELFTVAEGSNVTAGNFVQYKLSGDDRKYDTNTGYNSQFAESGNEAPKVLPLGNDRYIRRYKNNGEENVFWFNLIDLKEGFAVLSSISINGTNLPAFCPLNDGKIAICYMKKTNTITINIYDIESGFSLVSTYDLENENIGEIGVTHITQLGNGKIIVNKINDCFIFDYSYGSISLNIYKNLGFSYLSYVPKTDGDNDWNLHSTGENQFILFTKFLSRPGNSVLYKCYLIEYEEEKMEVLDENTVMEGSAGSSASDIVKFALNGALWGNAFCINGKILFSEGCDEGFGKITGTNYYGKAEKFFNTRVYFSNGKTIMRTSDTNLLDMSESAFSDLEKPSQDYLSSGYSSGTAQFVKENVFYVAVEPSFGASYNKKRRTAIFRVEYNPANGMFEKGNVVTFESEDIPSSFGGKFGYGQFFESESGDVYYLYETSNNVNDKKAGRWLMKLSYKDGTLSIGESTGMVENYNASGAAIGVAKQSGREGQMVEVYVPKV